jgi:hypothetical protein
VSRDANRLGLTGFVYRPGKLAYRKEISNRKAESCHLCDGYIRGILSSFEHIAVEDNEKEILFAMMLAQG